MKPCAFNKMGGIAVVLGGGLLALYSIGFFTLLPPLSANHDMVPFILNRHWTTLATTAFVALPLLMLGFAVVYARMAATAGVAGWFGIVLVEIAYLLQMCKVSWELFLWPFLAEHAAQTMRQRAILTTPAVHLFRALASLTILAGILLFCIALLRSRRYPSLGRQAAETFFFNVDRLVERAAAHYT